MAVQVGEIQSGDSVAANKAKFTLEDGKTTIPVQFNPEQYGTTDQTKYWFTKQKSDNPGKVQFVGKEQRQISLTLYFDTTQILSLDSTFIRAESDVTEKTKKIQALADYSGDEHRPQIVTFSWGSFSFRGVVSKVVTTFTQFTLEGMPVRAKVQVDMKEVLDSSAEKNHSPDRTKSRVLSEDLNIWTIAQREYGDAGKWREIAKANGILNPLEMETGTILNVPALKN